MEDPQKTRIIPVGIMAGIAACLIAVGAGLRTVMDSSLSCPRCGYLRFVKNGSIHNKKPKYKCQECGRQFAENPQKKR